MAKLTGADAHRRRILKAALVLLSKTGMERRDHTQCRRSLKGATACPVPPFEDKTGLLGAVAAYGFTDGLPCEDAPAHAQQQPGGGSSSRMDLHVEFGLANPRALPVDVRQSTAEGPELGRLSRCSASTCSAWQLQGSYESAWQEPAPCITLPRSA